MYLEKVTGSRPRGRVLVQRTIIDRPKSSYTRLIFQAYLHSGKCSTFLSLRQIISRCVFVVKERNMLSQEL